MSDESDVIILSSDDEPNTKQDNTKKRKRTNNTSGKSVVKKRKLHGSSNRKSKNVAEARASTSRNGRANLVVMEPKPSTSKASPEKPLLVVKEKQPISDLQDNLFAKFLDFCLSVSDTKDFVEKMKSKYKNVDPVYLQSDVFRDLLEKYIEDIKKDKNILYKCMIQVVEAMKRNCAKKRVELKTEVLNGSRNSNLFNELEMNDEEIKDDGETENNELDLPPATLQKLRKLDKVMQQCDRKIKELEAKEVNLDDDDESAYILEDKYKRKYMELYEKRCQLLKESFQSEKYLKLKHLGSKLTNINVLDEAIIAKVNMLIRKYNSATKKNRKKRTYAMAKEFFTPDFMDIYDWIKKVNEDEDLNLSKTKLEEMAEKACKVIGQELQKRRKLVLYRNIKTFEAEDLEDPAQSDPNLAQQLKNNYKKGQEKIEAVLEEYVKKERGLGEEEAREEEDLESEQENEDNEDAKSESVIENEDPMENIEESSSDDEDMNEKFKEESKRILEAEADFNEKVDNDGTSTSTKNDQEKLSDVLENASVVHDETCNDKSISKDNASIAKSHSGKKFNTASENTTKQSDSSLEKNAENLGSESCNKVATEENKQLNSSSSKSESNSGQKNMEEDSMINKETDKIIENEKEAVTCSLGEKESNSEKHVADTKLNKSNDSAFDKADPETNELFQNSKESDKSALVQSIAINNDEEKVKEKHLKKVADSNVVDKSVSLSTPQKNDKTEKVRNDKSRLKNEEKVPMSPAKQANNEKKTEIPLVNASPKTSNTPKTIIEKAHTVIKKTDKNLSLKNSESPIIKKSPKLVNLEKSFKQIDTDICVDDVVVEKQIIFTPAPVGIKSSPNKVTNVDNLKVVNPMAFAKKNYINKSPVSSHKVSEFNNLEPTDQLLKIFASDAVKNFQKTQIRNTEPTKNMCNKPAKVINEAYVSKNTPKVKKITPEVSLHVNPKSFILSSAECRNEPVKEVMEANLSKSKNSVIPQAIKKSTSPLKSSSETRSIPTKPFIKLKEFAKTPDSWVVTPDAKNTVINFPKASQVVKRNIKILSPNPLKKTSTPKQSKKIITSDPEVVDLSDEDSYEPPSKTMKAKDPLTLPSVPSGQRIRIIPRENVSGVTIKNVIHNYFSMPQLQKDN